MQNNRLAIPHCPKGISIDTQEPSETTAKMSKTCFGVYLYISVLPEYPLPVVSNRPLVCCLCVFDTREPSPCVFCVFLCVIYRPLKAALRLLNMALLPSTKSSEPPQSAIL